ncbi:MAG: hypothetical protein QXY62_00530 [Candidatus Altiarchaeota archaeon]
MEIKGFQEYRKREFCNSVKCPVQLELNKTKENSEEYEKIRDECKTNCRFSARDFHYWLINHGYIIIKPKEVK